MIPIGVHCFLLEGDRAWQCMVAAFCTSSGESDELHRRIPSCRPTSGPHYDHCGRSLRYRSVEMKPSFVRFSFHCFSLPFPAGRADRRPSENFWVDEEARTCENEIAKSTPAWSSHPTRVMKHNGNRILQPGRSKGGCIQVAVLEKNHIKLL